MSAVVTARIPLPPGWLAAALLLWGACAGALPSAVVMALLLEAVTFAPIKWQTATRDFHRATDLTSVLFAIVTVVQFQRYGVHGIYELLRASPYCFFPLVLTQRASTAQTLPLSALFYSLRRRAEETRRIDVAPAYGVVCLLAASTGEPHPRVFAVACAALVIGMLWAARPARWRAWQQFATLALGALLALALGFGLNAARNGFEAAFMYWMSQHPWLSSAPNRAVTAIGHIGRLKLSDRVHVRVAPQRDMQLPLVLHEASYDTFNYGSWSVQDSFEAVDQERGRDRWILGSATASPRTLELSFQHRHELTLLPLPAGTYAIDSTEVAEIQRNRVGAVMGEAPPGALHYTVHSGAAPPAGAPPRPADRIVPAAYQAVVARTAASIELAGATPAAAAARIKAFFLDNFSYSLVQRASRGRRTPLAHFLEQTRRGHCEHFATAAVLLLREAGIPARYAVGYVVEEYSALEDAYVARARHAHAWAEAWIDGAWVMLDATPSVWFGLEQARVSRWQSVQDLFGWLWYRCQRFASADFDALGNWLLWLVPPLALVLWLRLRRSPAAVRDARRRRAAPAHAPTPLDALLDELAARGFEPRPGETVARFLARAGQPERNGIRLANLVEYYYRLRFAPAAPGDAATLEANVRRYLGGDAP